ncbi:MAG: 50S ribosomal protein L10 [Polyangia bacterium]
MDRSTKEAQVEELKEKLSKTTSLLFADYRGIDVPTVTGLRDEFRKVHSEYRVYKNTLVKLAIKGTPMESIGKFFEGTTAIIFGYESPSAPAKVATKFAKAQEKDKVKFALKGGYFDGSLYEEKELEGLANMPGREELLANLASLLTSPASNLISLSMSSAQGFASILKTKGEQAEQAA